MIVKRISSFTGIENQMDLPITQEELLEWEDGDRPIQDCLPFLSPEQREFLINGTTTKEWNEMFGSEIYEELDNESK